MCDCICTLTNATGYCSVDAENECGKYNFLLLTVCGLDTRPRLPILSFPNVHRREEVRLAYCL